jgi:hypothetical protein
METLRFLNKQDNLNERQNFNGWWKEQININGQEVLYFTNNTTLSGSNSLYGEDPTADFDSSHPLIVLLNVNNDSILLSKFGIIADSDLSGVIHYETYTEIFGDSTEPKAGDVMTLSEFGSDRLNYPKRGPNTYQLTEVIDEFQGNPLGGHYVWFFKAKRYDYSNEGTGDNNPGPGQGNIALNDNDAANAAGIKNFDYPIDNPCSDTSVYGGY